MSCIAQTILVPLLEIECRLCGIRFCVCRRCWRGQRYCSETCRNAARREQHREAQRRYRRTGKGRRAHCEGENRRRIGLSRKCEAIMDDAGTTRRCLRHKMEPVDLKDSIARAEQLGYRVCRCHICGCLGVVVKRFPRRAYGRGRVTWEWEDERYGEKD